MQAHSVASVAPEKKHARTLVASSWEHEQKKNKITTANSVLCCFQYLCSQFTGEKVGIPHVCAKCVHDNGSHRKRKLYDWKRTKFDGSDSCPNIMELLCEFLFCSQSIP